MNLNKATVCIQARKDFGACYDFYTQKLGMVAVYGDRNGPYVSLATDAKTPACMGLFLAKNRTYYNGYTLPKEDTQPDTICLSIPTDDIHVDYARLKEAGVEFMGEPQLIEGWGVTTTLFRDPEGNLLELTNGTA